MFNHWAIELDFIHAAIYSNGGQRLKEDEFGRYVCGYFDSQYHRGLLPC